MDYEDLLMQIVRPLFVRTQIRIIDLQSRTFNGLIINAPPNCCLTINILLKNPVFDFIGQSKFGDKCMAGLDLY